MADCLYCGKELTGKQEKFCSRLHKSRWHNDRRKELMEAGAELEEPSKDDELRFQQQVNRDYLRGCTDAGGDPLAKCFRDLPYPLAFFEAEPETE